MAEAVKFGGPHSETYSPDTIFYDGHCGLCHGVVRWVMARDPQGKLFNFSPLQGQTFAAIVPEDVRAGLPDSVIVRTRGGHLLLRSEAALFILQRMGDKYRRMARWLGWFPRALRDLVYIFIARARKIVRRTNSLCPIMPEAQRRLFLP